VVKAKSQQGADSFSDFLQLIEQAAAGFPVELLPLSEENGCAPRAALLLDRTLAPTRKEALARALGSGRPETREKQRAALPDQLSPLPAIEHFIGCLQAELNRVKQTRLPCSLLLIRVAAPDVSFPRQAAVNLTKEIAGEHHLAPLDHATLALLLPGLNRDRALRQAGAIQQVLAAETEVRVKIGLAVCLARAVPAAREFMDMALAELQKAEQRTGDIFYSFQQQEEDDACQVTPEERAQLFSLLHKGKKE